MDINWQSMLDSWVNKGRAGMMAILIVVLVLQGWAIVDSHQTHFGF